mmetsp:Transcript_105520/g.305190  ORF Transcript_105520/g.305190 Transcript_105520/m.305190 type:complete len:230 (+) Transcript_105520:1354-2043(+)
MLATMTVLQLPPSESLNNRVNFESRYGTKEQPDAKALMQFPSASKERLMFAPSRSRTPRLSVCEARSEPARSIIDNFPIIVICPSPGAAGARRCSTTIWSTAWDLDEVTFMAVGSVVRRWLPRRRSSATSSAFSASVSVTPATVVPFSGSSRSSNNPRLGPSKGANKSRRFSLYTSTKEHRTETFNDPSADRSLASEAASKSDSTVRNMTPGSWGVPIIVKVLPAPVEP